VVGEAVRRTKATLGISPDTGGAGQQGLLIMLPLAAAAAAAAAAP
jgi:hypothetical protein